MKKLIFISLLSLSFVACKTNKAIQEEAGLKYDNSSAFHFINDIDASLSNVVDLAQKEGKLVFLDIYTDWCLPCKIMNEEVFTDQPLGDYFNENFISFKVNAEDGYGPNIAALYGVKGYPTLLFIDHNGRVLKQKDGMAFHSELREMAEQSILEDSKGSPSE